MNTYRSQLAMLSLMTLVLASPLAAETVVYDNTKTYLGTDVLLVSLEMGNEVTLAENVRVVTGFDLFLRFAGEGTIPFVARVRFYLNDGGFGGSPGTPLWVSDRIDLTIDGGKPVLFHFDVPDVRVPDTFTWTFVLLDGPDEIQFLGISQFHPPTVGSVRFGRWRSSLGPIPWLFQKDKAPFGARITAKAGPPLPTVSGWGLVVMTLALLTAAVLIMRRRWSVRAASIIVGLVVCTPAIAGEIQVGAQVRIDVGGGAAAANETSIASSNFDPDEIVAAWNDYRAAPPNPTPSEYIIRVGVAISGDGGATWNDFLLRPPLAYRTDIEADPMTAYDDRTGTLWVGGIAFDVNPGDTGGVFVARKDPGESTFQPTVMARVSNNAGKGWMAAGPDPLDPNATNLYIAYSEGVIASYDMGDTWTDPVFVGFSTAWLPRVASNGDLYVAYPESNGNRLFLRRSDDSGATFEPRRTIVTLNSLLTTSDFPGTFRVPQFAYLAIDPDDGTLYCVYSDKTDVVNGNVNVDLYLTKSTNNGLSWSTPTIINGDADPPGDQFFPWIETDENGDLHLVFLDSRHTDQDDQVVNGMFDAYYAFSRDGGATWQEERLTTASFDSDDDGLDATEQFLGDYLGLARGGCSAYPCYLSTKNGDPDIYTHDVTVEAACCIFRQGQYQCFDKTRCACEQLGGIFKPLKTCATLPAGCPQQESATPPGDEPQPQTP